MFIATTHTPSEEITKEEATENFLHLIGRACEYIKELERWRCALVADSHQMREAGEKQAHQDFSRGIMEAYKKVNM